MSVGSVFAFLFQTQGADKVKSELKGLISSEKETERATNKLANADDNLKNKNLELAKSVGGLISTYVGFKKILSEVMGFAAGGEDLVLMAQQAGVGAETLERYGVALQNYGGGLSSAASSLGGLVILFWGDAGKAERAEGVGITGRTGVYPAEAWTGWAPVACRARPPPLESQQDAAV